MMGEEAASAASLACPDSVGGWSTANDHKEVSSGMASAPVSVLLGSAQLRPLCVADSAASAPNRTPGLCSRITSAFGYGCAVINRSKTEL